MGGGSERLGTASIELDVAIEEECELTSGERLSEGAAREWDFGMDIGIEGLRGAEGDRMMDADFGEGMIEGSRFDNEGE